MASAARLARNRRTVANVIALGQGGGADVDAWQSAFLLGANVYTQAQNNELIAGGFTPKVFNMFNENAAGVEGWASNFNKSAQNLSNYTWARDAGLKFDIITLTASPQEPLSEFIAGAHDAQYLQIIRNSVALAGPNADVIFMPHDHEMDLRIQPDGHYAHTANQPGGNADFLANWDRIWALTRTEDPRIKLGIVRICNTTPYTAGWDWKDAMPPREKLHWFGADPYFIPRYNGPDGARAAYDKLQGPNGLQAWRDFYYGLAFAFREYGASSNDVAFHEVMFDWLAEYLWNMYVNVFDQNPGGAVGINFDTRIRYWKDQLAWFAKEQAPPVLLTPSTANVEANTPTRIRLRCTKNRIKWTIIGNSNPAAVVMAEDGKSLMVNLASGTATVTVRASDPYKQRTDLTITIPVASANLYPVMDTGLDCMMGTDGEPAVGPEDDFIYGLAA
jgi:hypothetical protein